MRGQRAINGNRKSLPSLGMVASDLASVLAENYRGEPEADTYLEQLRTIKKSSD